MKAAINYPDTGGHSSLLKRLFRFGMMVFSILAVVQVILWFVVARDRLEGTAWVALVAAQLEDADEQVFARCISVEPELYNLTPRENRRRIATLLDAHGVELLVAPPTHNPPTGYLDRECVEIFRAPEELGGHNLPIIAQANTAYCTYDFNGSAVLMVQLGTRWVYLAHWSQWI